MSHLLIMPHGQRSRPFRFPKHEIFRLFSDKPELRLDLHCPHMGRCEQNDKEDWHDDDEGCVAWQWVFHDNVALISIVLFEFHQVLSRK